MSKVRSNSQIAKEGIKQPTLSRDQILFWFHRLRKMDVKKLEHRRRLIDSFINSIYLYDDHMVITFNYKDGAKTITFEEIENAINGSDLAGFAFIPRREASAPFLLQSFRGSVMIKTANRNTEKGR